MKREIMDERAVMHPPINRIRRVVKLETGFVTT